MTLYGMPYQGSKSKLAGKILDILPAADNFYDLFAGGGSVSHYATTMPLKFGKVYTNDNDKFVMDAFDRAIQDGFKHENHFADIAEFKYKRRTDPYISCCFSFGNNWRTYAYSREIEDYKRQYHNAVFFGDGAGMRQYGIDLKEPLKNADKFSIELRYSIVQQQIRAQSSKVDTIHIVLPHYNAFQRVLRLANIPRPIITALDYRDVVIKPYSVVYCDIPYKGTGTYNYQSFDYDAFYEWCGKQEQLTFISEYEMPDNFLKVASFDHRTIFGPVPKCMHPVKECLFVPKHQYDLLTPHLQHQIKVLQNDCQTLHDRGEVEPLFWNA